VAACERREGRQVETGAEGAIRARTMFAIANWCAKREVARERMEPPVSRVRSPEGRAATHVAGWWSTADD
jgi:hypothetical protein